ncbi:MAG: PBP1A family penicillin-binding protein [Pseudomonadota bacterium]
MGVTALLAYYHFAEGLPPVDNLKNYLPKTVTFFYGDDGRTVVGEYSHERRIVVPLAKIPLQVRQAFIAAEDSNFYQHEGIDLTSVIRAFVKNVEAGRIVQGGSTITQQVTRSFLLSAEKTYKRKIREAILAYRIEKNLTKEEILYLYLNQIYLGHGAWGVESAAELYFNKHVDALTLAEAAQLAGLTQAPSRYSPFSQPKAARGRQVYTLNQMVKNNFITPAQAEAAKAEKLVFYDRPNVNLTMTPYFTEHVRRLLEKQYGEDRLYNDGLKVYTTVSVSMQAEAGKAIAQGLSEFAKRRPYEGPIRKLKPEEIPAFLARQDQELSEKPLAPGREIEAVVSKIDAVHNNLYVKVGAHDGLIDMKGLRWVLFRGKPLDKLVAPGDVVLVQAVGKGPELKNEEDKKKAAGKAPDWPGWLFTLEQEPAVHSALMCLDNKDGAVKAMVGGRDFNETQFNRAIQSRRQPGSAFKAILYTAAMLNDFTPGSILIDSPIVYDDFAHGRRWKPTNFDRKFYGPTDLYTGLTSSRNVMAVKLLDKVGYLAVLETAKKLGITSPLAENLSLALGSSGVSLAEMVTAFSTFPNLGERVVPMFITRIEDRDGQVIEEFKPTRLQVIDPGTACVMQHMLRGVVAHGTGVKVLELNRPAGGKTGTTNDLSDAWFIGFTPEYTTGVWVGLDEMKRMGWGESGGRAAAPIFLYFMKEALKGKPIRQFEDPPDVEIVPNGSVGICYKKGTRGKGYSEVGGGAKGDFLKNDLGGKDL